MNKSVNTTTTRTQTLMAEAGLCFEEMKKDATELGFTAARVGMKTGALGVRATNGGLLLVEAGLDVGMEYVPRTRDEMKAAFASAKKSASKLNVINKDGVVVEDNNS